MTTPNVLYSNSPNFVITYNSVSPGGRSPVKSSSSGTAQWNIQPKNDGTNDRYISPSDPDTILEVDNNLLYVVSGTGSAWTMTNQTKGSGGQTYYTITNGTLEWILNPAEAGIQVSLVQVGSAVPANSTPSFGCITGC